VKYSRTLLEHFRHPRNAGMMLSPDGTGQAEDATCGDRARFFLRVDAGRAVQVRFQTYGCGPTIAAASAGSELARGRPVTDLLRLSRDDVEDAVDGLPDERKHAADVVAQAIRSAAQDYVRRHV
jgi:nitrogen fixation NifU-like protein